MKTTIYYSVLLLAFVALFSCENTVYNDLLANSETETAILDCGFIAIDKTFISEDNYALSDYSLCL